jgi:hypothetical protein
MEVQHVNDTEPLAEHDHAVGGFFTACDESEMDWDSENNDLPSVDALEKCIMCFLAKLQSKPNITLNNVQSVADNLTCVAEEFCNHAVNVVRQMCTALCVSSEQPCVLDVCGKLSSAKDVTRNVNTVYKRNKWLARNGFYVSPNEITLGTHEVQHFSARKHATCSVLEDDTYQLIPLNELLGKVMENSSAQLLQYQRSSAGSGVLKEFWDGTFSVNHPFLRRYPDALVLQFFVDAYETVNPLGSHTSVHKLEGLYCVIRNLPQQVLSKTSNIFLIGLWYAADVRRYGYNQILAPLYSQLKQLESEEGLNDM